MGLILLGFENEDAILLFASKIGVLAIVGIRNAEDTFKTSLDENDDITCIVYPDFLYK